jgi:hypothetical protein
MNILCLLSSSSILQFTQIMMSLPSSTLHNHQAHTGRLYSQQPQPRHMMTLMPKPEREAIQGGADTPRKNASWSLNPRSMASLRAVFPSLQRDE